MRQKRQMDKLRFLTESRNGKESVIEKLIHKDNSSSNRISCSIAEKSDIKSVMDICFARQQWMTEQGFNYVLNKDNRKYYRHKIEDRKLWVCKQSGVVMGFCVVEDHDINGYWKDFPTDSFVYAHDGMTRPHKSVKETSDYNFMGILLNAIIDFYGKGIRFDVLLPNQKLESFYEKELGCNPVKKVIDEDDGSWHLLMEKTNNNLSLSESFTKKIKSVRKSNLISEPAFFPGDGVYILHETLGVRGVEGWNPKDNDGVIGVLVVEDEHQIVIALEDSPEELQWSKEHKLVNQPIENRKDAESDFNGEEYCRNLNSPEFPAAYYCLNYKKGNRSWYLPSAGELWLIYLHLEEIQSALSIVGGQKFVSDWKGVGMPLYWSSTEGSAKSAWNVDFGTSILDYGLEYNNVVHRLSVRPISKFQPSELKESFTKKISSKKNTDLISKPAFVLDDGVYILHKSLGVKTVEGWNKKFNKGVVGILLIEDEHQIVVALEDSPDTLRWSKAKKLVNQPIGIDFAKAKSDFNGEKYCRNLNSPDFPAAYYCLNYKKGGRSWYLPSTGEMKMIFRHLEEIQNVLSIVGGQEFVTLNSLASYYWSSTETDAANAWCLRLYSGFLNSGVFKNSYRFKVRPISKFQPSELKESFTKKISHKKSNELLPHLITDGVFIFHQTLGLKTVEEWDRKDNLGVVGILIVQDGHQIVISLDEFLENFHWSKEKGLINKPIYGKSNAWSDFNGEEYCKELDSEDFPAAFQCIHYKSNYNWYLPSAGEMGIIYQNLHDVQLALRMVGGCQIREGFYLSSSESDASNIWGFNTRFGEPNNFCDKIIDCGWVRPVFKFNSNFLKESFTKKISSKRNTDLISKPSFVLDDGVYILHETLGVRTVEGWNPDDNEGVVGVLLVEGDHKIVIAMEDSPNNLSWSKEEDELVNQLIRNEKDAKSDFNGEEYCRKLNSPDFPAAYYCLNYNKGDRNWYLPSTGELWLIYQHLEDIQNALSIVEGQRFVTTWDFTTWDVGLKSCYWSSTENSPSGAWRLHLSNGFLDRWHDKVINSGKVRPISKFQPSELKESFTHKIRKTSNKDLVDIADKLATTNFDYNEENFKNKLRKETELYYKSEFYKVYNYPLDYRRNGDFWSADENGFHEMWLESTYYAERNEVVDFEGYYNDVDNNYAEPADVGIFVFGYGKDCVAYGEYEEYKKYKKTLHLTESFVSKTKKKTNKDLQDKSDDVFNLDNLLREYVKSHCLPGSHNYDFFFRKNGPVFSDNKWKKLKGITVVKEVDEYYPRLHLVSPHGFTLNNIFLPNVDDVFLFYTNQGHKFHITVDRLPEKPLQELREWILNINESFSHKIKQKSTEDLRQKADEHIGFENLVKAIVLENDSFIEFNTPLSRTYRNRQPRCTHVLNKLRVRPTTDPTLSPFEMAGTVVLDKSFYFKPEKYDISSLLAKNKLTRKFMKELYNSDSIIVLSRIFTTEYLGKEYLNAEFNILRYDERKNFYTDAMNPCHPHFEFTDLPKELQSDIYSFLRKKFVKK